MGYIIWAVIIISVLRAIFSNDPKKKAKNQRARDRAAADSNTGGRPSLDEVTRRKREQLQELARQKAGGRPGAGGNISAGDADPGNMTMAERIARARAKQQYEQRAAQAGQGRQAPPPQAGPSSRRPVPATGPSGGRGGAGPRQQRAEALRQQLEARKLQQRQAQARRQQQIQQAKSQRSAPPRRPRPAPTPAPGSVPHGINVPEHDQVHRMVKNVDEQPMKIGSSRRQAETGGADSPSARRRSTAGINFAKLSKADLRRAFILKEVLDKPIAERDPLADVMGG